MKQKRVLAAVLAAAMTLSVWVPLSVPASAETSQQDPFIAQLKSQFDDPEIEYRPEVRWWLAEGMHTDETLEQEVQAIYDAGFGAAEFLAMPEEGADSSLYGWGSAEWISDSKKIIEEATKKGLGVSMTSGTHWANANLPDTYTWAGKPFNPDNSAAAKEIGYTQVAVGNGSSFDGALQTYDLSALNHVTQQELVAVIAAKVIDATAEKPVLAVDTIDLTSAVDTSDPEHPTLNWTNDTGSDCLLFAFWMYGTGKAEVPSVANNYVVNYIDPDGFEAVMDYWEENILTPDMQELIRQNGRVEMYMDSLELEVSGNGGQFWGRTFADEFQSRRGYDLIPYLPFIIKSGDGSWKSGGDHWYGNESDQDAKLEKVRNDLYQTMTDLYIDNVLSPLQEWLHSYGINLRAEPSYGTHFEISTPGKYLDDIETESLEFGTQPDLFRNFSGSAHLYDKQLSSETGAYMLGNYAQNLNFYTQIINTQLSVGISRTVLHGYSSIRGSESNTAWPGHEGMLSIFSERFGSRQPASQHYDDWTTMIARNQKILRQGKPRVDIGILRTDYDLYASLSSGNAIFPQNDKKYFWENQGFYWQDMTLQNKGYTYDYFSPEILTDSDISFDGMVQPDGPGYQALILYQDKLPLDSAEQILRWAKDGGLPVVLVNNATENTRLRSLTSSGLTETTYEQAAAFTPYDDGNDDQLAAVVSELTSLSNVKVVDNPCDTYDALVSLGVYPRTEFTEPNANLITYTRETDDELYVYAYNYMYEESDPYTAEIAIDAVGKPYSYNTWTGEANEIGAYRVENGRTYVTITLKPGDTTIIALDLTDTEGTHAVSSNADRVFTANGTRFIEATDSGIYTTILNDGSHYTTDVQVPEKISLSTWDLTVEDWNSGEKKTVTEDRPAGWASPDSPAYTTTEVYYETSKNRIEVGKTELLPWKDIEQVGPDVSGIGYYTTEFDLPDEWNVCNGMYLDLGSVNGNTAAVFINGKKAPAVDINNCRTDISGLLQPGKNQITVEVSSTLLNRVRSQGYVGDMSAIGVPIKLPYSYLPVQDYGMTGDVQLVPYTVTALVHKDGLKQAVDTITGAIAKLNQADYTSGSWETLQTSLANAVEILDSSNATQEQVDQAFSDLLTAWADLEKTEPVKTDKSVLDTLVEIAKSLDESAYTAQSWENLKAAIRTAELTLADPNASQAEIDQAVQAIKEAIQSLASPAPQPGQDQNITPDPDGQTASPPQTGDSSRFHSVWLLLASALLAVSAFTMKKHKNRIEK